MIMALIASGRIFAHIIDIDPAQNNAFGVILKITAYVIPYAFIPLTFKVAGGVFGNLAGMVNDRGKGGFDRLRKKRQEATQQLGRNVKGGVGARGNQQNFLNRSTSAIASGPKGWRPGKRGADHRAASRNTGAMLAGQAQLEANKTHQMHKNNDAYQLALADEGLAQTKINEARQDYDVAEKAGDVEKMRNAKANIANREGALAAARSIPHKTNATRRQAALELASTGYQFSAGRKGYSELSAIADSVSGGDAAARAEFMDNAQFNLKQAGRYDLGGINHGAGYDFKSSISKASGYQAGNAKPETHRTGAAELLGQEFMTEDGKTLEAPEFAATLHAKAASGALNVEDFKLHHRNLIDAYNGATGANREEIGKQLSAIEALNNGPTPADEAGVNRILNLQQVVQANQQEAYRNQPLSRAQIDANNNPPQPGGPV